MSSARLVGPNRREFFARVAGAAAAAAAVSAGPPALAASHEFPSDGDGRNARRRANEAYEVRHRAALFQRFQDIADHPTNRDEQRYANKIGSFSKALPHDAFGEVDLDAYAALVHAMETGDPADFELIPFGGRRQARESPGRFRVRLRRRRHACPRAAEAAGVCQR
jgi:hypothetical protein